MPHPHPFVGRKTELEQFDSVLADPAPQAILVVGQQGMGKTMLVNELAENARNHQNLKCGAVRHEITKTDTCRVLITIPFCRSRPVWVFSTNVSLCGLYQGPLLPGRL